MEQKEQKPLLAGSYKRYSDEELESLALVTPQDIAALKARLKSDPRFDEIKRYMDAKATDKGAE